MTSRMIWHKTWMAPFGVGGGSLGPGGSSGLVGLSSSGGERAVDKMSQEALWGDVGVAEGSIADGVKVDVRHGEENHALELFLDSDVGAVYSQLAVVLSVGFGDLGSSGSGCMDGLVTWVRRCREGHAGTGEVISVGHD